MWLSQEFAHILGVYCLSLSSGVCSVSRIHTDVILSGVTLSNVLRFNHARCFLSLLNKLTDSASLRPILKVFPVHGQGPSIIWVVVP